MANHKLTMGEAWNGLLTHPLFWLLFGGLLVRGMVALILNPGFDEAYYYLYSRHLNWSYFDHPPLVALTTGLGWWLTRVISPLTIRLGALGLYVLSLWFLYRSAVKLFGLAVGRMTVAIATLIPLFAFAFGVLTAPDNSLIFFWTITLYWAVQQFFPAPHLSIQGTLLHNKLPLQPYRPTWHVALFGLWVGLACLSKYHGFILGLSLVGFCLTSRRYRTVFWSPWTLLALALFGITLLPLLYWNWQHDWISFRFQLFLRFDGAEPSPFRPLQMIGYWLITILYLFPTFGFPLWWVTGRQLWHFFQTWRRPQSLPPELAAFQEKRALIFWLALPIAVGFTLLGGKTQIFPAWPAPGLWVMSLLLGMQAVQWQRQSPRGVRRWLWGSGITLVTLILIALLHLSLGIFQKQGQYSLLGGFLNAREDPATELIDIQQLRRQLAESSTVQAALPQVSFVFTNEFYLGGYIDMALHPLAPLPVTCFSQDPRGFAFWFDQQAWLGEDALWITQERFVETPELLNIFQEHFTTLEEIERFPLKRAGAVTEVFYVYRARTFERPYLYPYGS